MYCENCGAEVPDNAEFCSECGKRVKAQHKNVYLALILTFIITGLGTIYAGNLKKGLILLAARVVPAFLGALFTPLLVLSILVWAFAFYEAYRDVQIANGHKNPRLINDFKGWNQNSKIIAVLIVAIILIITFSLSAVVLSVNDDYSGDSSTHYYVSNSGSSGGYSSSSHYGGVDDSPRTIAKNDPDWYYEHYEYGDDPEIDDYLESQGYD